MEIRKILGSRDHEEGTKARPTEEGGRTRHEGTEARSREQESGMMGAGHPAITAY
jgi:hypothetical protein